MSISALRAVRIDENRNTGPNRVLGDTRRLMDHTATGLPLRDRSLQDIGEVTAPV